MADRSTPEAALTAAGGLGAVTIARIIADGAAVLSDAARALPAAAWPAHFEALDARLEAGGVDPDAALAVICPQSAAGGLLLLYLLDRGRSFALLPPELPDLEAIVAELTVCAASVALTGHAQPDPWDGLEVTPIAGGGQRSVERGSMFVRTSGSMGRSKLVGYRHAALMGNALGCVERFGLRAADRVMLPVPITHMYGLGAGFLPALLAGATCELVANASLPRYLDRERAFDPDVAFLTPALCEMMVRRRRAARPHRLVVTAGGRIGEAVFRAFDERFGPLVNLYGSSEMGAVAAHRTDAPIDVRARVLGAALAGVALRIDAEGDDPSTGELYCRHENGFMGYFGPDGAAIAAATEWFATRDRVHRDEGGGLRVLGRIDNAVNRDGRLVMFADIERVMEQDDGVACAVVVRASGETMRGPKIAAWYAPTRPDAADADVLRRRLRATLPLYAMPDAVYVCDDLPRLPSGKPDRRALARAIPELPPRRRR